MNKVLKWILIGLGVAVVAFGVALAAFRGFALRPMMMGARGFGFERGVGGMMFGMGLSIIFRIFLGLVVLGLAVFGVISLFRQNKKPSTNNVAPASSVTLVEPVGNTEPVEPAVGTEPEKVCAKCGKPLQADWRNCPYCGKKQ